MTVLKTEFFLKILNDADASPISIKDDSFNKENYWLVSILPHMSKVFERILYKRIDTFVTTKCSPCICGFRKNDNAHDLFSLENDRNLEKNIWVKETK